MDGLQQTGFTTAVFTKNKVVLRQGTDTGFAQISVLKCSQGG